MATGRTDVAGRRWVCLDVGETLVDETRAWSTWADVLGIPRLTFHAVLGAAIARGGDYRDVFPAVGAFDWRSRIPEVEAAYGGFREEDLYPDARRCLAGLRAAGYRIGVVANQPAARTAQLRGLGIEAEVVAMSGELGVAKPDPAFFARILELLGGPAAVDVAYVGDRVDNDVVPALAAGMRAIWIRRGPWGFIRGLADGVAPTLAVDSLDELVARIDDAWAAPAG